MRLGVLVPCRNERPVVARRIANLARIAWPAKGPHRVLVVDDGSTDGTAERARSALPGPRGPGLREPGPSEPAAVRFEVLEGGDPPGKAGAMRAGIEALGSDVDLVVLTDADVVLDEACLVHLAAAFSADPELGMASAAQHFVRDLADDGTACAADGGELRPAGDLYDRATAAVRRLESRRGLLFSVHGQCLAWRAELGLLPTPGIAADDIELRQEVRRLGRAVRLVPEARFHEVKTPPGEAGRAQALRRARAYFQVLREGPRPRPASSVEALQVAFYRTVPRLAPELAALGLAGGVLAGAGAGGATGAGLVAAGLLAAAASPRGRELVRLADTIRRARRASGGAPPSDRWEMQRS